MDSFNVLDRHLVLQQRIFLEASAGTGKTFAIEHLIIRLLIEKEFTLSQILAVTFTRKAAREMKQRIQQSLKKLLYSYATSAPTGWDYADHLFEKEPEILQKTIRKIQEALLSFDEAQIFTIHGFCLRMIQEFPFEASYNFYPLFGDQKKEIKACIKKYLTHISKTDYGFYEWNALLKTHKQRIDNVIDAICEKVIQMTEFSKYDERHILLEQLKAFHQQWKHRIQQDAFLPEFTREAGRYKRMAAESWVEQMRQLMDFLNQEQFSWQQLDKLLAFKQWPMDKMHPSQLKVAAEPGCFSPTHALFFQELQQKFAGALRGLQDPALLFDHLVGACYAEWHSERVDDESLSFHAILLNMQQAIKNPAFVSCIHQRFSAVIVDEFQDTDPVQWDIFKRLFLDHPSMRLFFVGDPKQSIYGFRNSDVYTYLSAMAHFEEHQRARLSLNFRSVPSLVEALNTIFTSGHWADLPQAQGKLSYQKVMAAKSDPPLNEAFKNGRIHFFLTQQHETKERTHPSKRDEQAALFPYVLQEIHKLKAGIPLSQMVILVKDRFQAQRMQSFLQRHQVSAQIQKSSLLSESFSIETMKDLLMACKKLNMHTFKVILAGPLGGWTAEQLSQDKDLLMNAMERFKWLQQLFDSKGFAVFFDSFLKSSILETGPLVIETLISKGSFYQEFCQLAEYLMQIEYEQQATVDDLLKILQDLDEQDPEKYPRLKMRFEDDQDQLAIMTVFASKGLEYEVVFALALCSRHGVEEIDALKLEEKEAEKMRQLYVALTRAKSSVYIPMIIEKEAKPVTLGSASAIELFLAKMVSQQAGFKELYAKLPLSIESATALLDRWNSSCSLSYEWVSQKPFTFPEDLSQKNAMQLVPPSAITLSVPKRFMLSYSLLSKQQIEPMMPALPKQQAINQLPRGAETGNILHELLEKVFKKKMHSSMQKKKRELFLKEELEKTSLNEHSSEINSLISELLEKPISLGFSLAEIPENSLYPEFEFLFPLKDEWIKGFIDLVFYKDQRYYFIDWKSNDLGVEPHSYSQENMEQAMTLHHYYMQAGLYAAALERYVKLFDNRPFSESFGGSIYVFLRGKAFYHFMPQPIDETVIEEKLYESIR